jgi:hypothetical protein
MNWKRLLTGWDRQIKRGFLQDEIGQDRDFSEYIADPSNRKGEHHDSLGQLIDNLPSDWTDLQPMPSSDPQSAG